MESVIERPGVRRVRQALARAGLRVRVQELASSARTALEAAESLGVSVGQIASSLVFRHVNGEPVLVITSGRHRVDAALVASSLGVPELLRVDADFVKAWSGFSIGGVSPLGWESQSSGATTEFGFPAEVTVLIDEALGDYDVIWAAAGHPHAVFATCFEDLRVATGARVVRVSQV